MNGLSTIQGMLASGIAFFALASLLVSFLIPTLIRSTACWTPSATHRSIFLAACAPVVITCAALLAVVLPSLLASVDLGNDHCLAHDHHAHLCIVHLNHEFGSNVGWLALSAVGLAASYGANLGIRKIIRAREIVARIASSSTYEVTHDWHVVPTPQVFCFTAGFLRPKTFVSTGFLHGLAKKERHVVCAHERAHRMRRDSLRRIVAEAGTVLFVPSLRRRLLDALELAAERACDEVAARSSGERLDVAETLLSVEKGASRDFQTAFVSNFEKKFVTQRIESLLAPAAHRGNGSWVAMALITAVLLILGLHDVLHHATESGLSHLFD